MEGLVFLLLGLAFAVVALAIIVYSAAYPFVLVADLVRGRRRRRRWLHLLVWLLCVVVVAIMIPLYANVGSRARLAKAQADTRALGSAAQIYLQHCGGLPPGGPSVADDCPTTATGGGPLPVPEALTRRQTNSRGQVAGPFMNVLPTLPGGWAGVGEGYEYHVGPDAGFRFCARGAEGVANSKPRRLSG